MTPSTSSPPSTLSTANAGPSSRASAPVVGRPLSFRDRITVGHRRELLERLRTRIQPGPGVRLLDLGGGAGAATELFARGASEIVVVDPEPSRVTRGRASRPALTFVEGPAEALPFPGGRFERVVSSLSFHHFQDGAKALSEAYRVLAPGGSLFVCDVEASSWRGRLFRFLHRASRHRPLSFPSAAVVDAWLANAGFLGVQRERFGPYYLLTARK